MTARDLWARIALTTLFACMLLLFVSPAHPEHRVPAALAVLAGVGAGALLFAGATRRRPRLPSARGRVSLFLARHGLLGLWAANEEIIWRRVVLGGLLPVGTLAAFAVSSLSFALAHRRRRALHAGTGAVFGGIFIATGSLAACVTAHWTYNALVGAHVDRVHGLVELPP